MTKSNSGRKVHISAYGSISQLNAAYTLGLHGWLSMLEAQDHHPREALPTVGSASHIKHQLRKYHTGLSTGQSGGDIFFQ